MDAAAFDKTISTWEWNWVNTQKPYPVATKSNSILLAQQLYQKYRVKIGTDLK